MKVLITDPISQSGISILEDAGIKTIKLFNGSNSDKIKASSDVSGWIIRSGTTIDAKTIKTSKNLRVIGLSLIHI